MKNRNRTILFSFLLLLSIVASWSYSVSADVTYDNTTVFNVGNENYTFPAGGITLSQVMLNESGSWIKFNDTDFNITSSNPINITLSYLNSNIAGASTGDTVLSFSANTVSGSVWFNLSGFKSSTTYTLYRNSAVVAAYVSDGSGLLSFSNGVWSDHDFELREGDQTGASSDNYFLLNDPDGNNDYSDFTFSSDDYDSLSFYFKLSASHDNCTVYLKDSSGNVICQFNISGTSVNFYDGAFTQVISVDTWYRIVTSFDWLTDNVTGKIYQGSSLLKSGTDIFSSGITDLSVFNISGVSGSAAYVMFDNIAVSSVSENGDDTLNDIRGHIYDAIGGGFQGLGATGNYIPLIVLGVVIFLVLSMILSLGFFGGSKNNGGSDSAL